MVKTALAFVLLMFLAKPLFAQTTEPTTVDPTTTDPSATATVHFGQLALRPTLALTNLGVDTNVFYQPDQESPKSDFTATVTPATDLWLRLGRSWLTGTVKEDLVYYRRYASERSVNGFYDAGLLVPLNRVIFNAGGSYLDTRERPSFEIDVRSQRYETRANGSIEVRTLPKTFFGVRVERATIDFAQSAEFLGTSLQYALNRTTSTAALTVRHRLTPLTTLTLDVAR